MKTVVVGKLGEVNLNNLSCKIKKRHIVKIATLTVATIAAIILVQDTTMAAEINNVSLNGYGNPVELQPILSFLNWIMELIRKMIGVVMSIMSTYAGWLILTQRHKEAQEILLNQVYGAVLVFFGPSIVHLFVDKLVSFL